MSDKGPTVINTGGGGGGGGWVVAVILAIVIVLGALWIFNGFGGSGGDVNVDGPDVTIEAPETPPAGEAPAPEAPAPAEPAPAAPAEPPAGGDTAPQPAD